MVTHKMASEDVRVVQAQPVPDSAMLCARLENTRMEFHRLLDSVVEEKWHCKSPTCDWTMGEVLLHLTWALEQLPEEVESARRGKGMFNYPKWIANSEPIAAHMRLPKAKPWESCRTFSERHAAIQHD